MSTIGKLFLITMTTFALAACGFHLRGQAGKTELPVREITVTGTTSTANALRSYLEEQPDYQLQPVLSANGIEISVLQPLRKRQVSSINSSGQVTEYRLTLRVPISIRNHKDILLNNGSVTVTRDLSWDENSVLAKEEEEEQLWQTMEQDAVQFILYRAGAITRKYIRDSNAPSASFPESTPANAS